MYKFIVFGALLHGTFFLQAQSVSTLMGARAQGLGYASSCLKDEWAIFNNAGGLADIDHTTAAFTYASYPGFKPFNRMAAIVAVPSTYGVAGLGVFRFGDDLYNEQILTAAFSNTFGIASLGAKLNYIQYNAEGFGRRGVASFSFGGITRLTSRFSIGAHITNIFQPEISEGERLPTLLAVGIGFTPSDKLLLTSEIEKDIEFPFTWKAGLEYKVYKKFTFRTGFNIRPQAAFFGFGFTPSLFQLDYAYSHSMNMGAQHQASVSYRFKKK